MHFTKLLFLVIFSAIIILGCTSWETGKPIMASTISKINKNKTTQLEIIQFFGTPEIVDILNGENIIYTYRYCLRHNRAESIQKETCDELYIVFDKSSVVKHFKYDSNINRVDK